MNYCIQKKEKTQVLTVIIPIADFSPVIFANGSNSTLHKWADKWQMFR